METQSLTIVKRPGPVKKKGRTQYSVILDADLAEWAKDQPNGLSGMIRQLLEAERKKVERRNP